MRPWYGDAAVNSGLRGTLAAVERRIFGMENEYGVTCTLRGQRRLSPDEVARYLFRRVVSWGRSSNVFLENGARLYLDVGSHPEYATPECDSLYDLVAHDRAGERVLEGLLHSAARSFDSSRQCPKAAGGDLFESHGAIRHGALPGRAGPGVGRAELAG